MSIYNVVVTKQVERSLRKLPAAIVLKLQSWVHSVMTKGLHETRRISGYHDELLQGVRSGQRSIRLNKAYRAIYLIDKNNIVHFIKVIEVNKHEY